MMKFLIGILLVLPYFSLANADESYSPAVIKAVQYVASCMNDFEALAQVETCMNTRAAEVGIPRTSEYEVINDWVVGQVEVDPIDDTYSVQITVQALKTLRKLVLRCDANKTYMILGKNSLRDNPPSEAIVAVDTRLDKLESQNQQWQNVNGVLFLPRPIGFIKQIMLSEQLVIRPAGEPSEIFEVNGLPKAIEPIRKYCNW